MADKTLPPEGLPGGGTTSAVRSERRAFLRRAVGVGVPVVLATVRGRSVLAQGENETLAGSGCASMHPSGWLNPDGESFNDRKLSCDQWAQEGDQLVEPLSEPEPVFNLDPVDDSKGGNGWGKGGKPK